jgi:hypothetical protein
MIRPLVLHDPALPDALYQRLLSHVDGIGLRYGSRSNRVSDPHGHWSWKPMHDNRHNLADLSGRLPPLIDEVWRVLSERHLAAGSKLIRCYVNGYTYGTDGYFHSDSQRADESTTLIYLCRQWDKDWAGETVIELADDFASVLPAPNRLIQFDAQLPHCARAVSRKCPELRLVLVFKTRPARSLLFEQLSGWLVERGALELKHRDSSLHDHLLRCCQLATDHNLADHLRLAAGLHSIYGTAAYQQQLLAPVADSRAQVSRLWGEKAEALAYMFSVLDRPRALDAIGMVKDKPVPAKLSYDQQAALPALMARDLQLIECINLTDQDSLGNWPYLRQLWEATRKP